MGPKMAVIAKSQHVAAMGMVQVHAFPCSNVLYGANNVIFFFDSIYFSLNPIIFYG